MTTQTINATLQLEMPTLDTLVNTNINNWYPAGLDNSFAIRFTTDSNPHNITGLAGGFDGRVIIIENSGENEVILVSSSSSSSVGNRFDFIEDIHLQPSDGVILRYSNSVWRCVGKSTGVSGTNMLEIKGSLACNTNPNYPTALAGDLYLVSIAGKVGGASGKSVDAGDVIIAYANNAGGTEASVGSSWFVLEHNLVGALVASNNLSDLSSATTARSNLGLGNSATRNVGTASTDVAAGDRGVTNGDSHDHAGGDGAQVQTATTLTGDQTNWYSLRSSAVANMLGWKNYGNGHVIFDASNGTAPDGSSHNNSNPEVSWAATYPTLMGWNGGNTFGIKVDLAHQVEGVSGTYTPSTTGLTIGNGTLTASYTYIGKVIVGEIVFTLGTTSAVTGDVSFSFPFTLSSISVMNGLLVDTGVNGYLGAPDATTTAIYVRCARVSGSNITMSTALTSTLPFTWGNGDVIKARYIGILP